jgi:hypothetical protein
LKFEFVNDKTGEATGSFTPSLDLNLGDLVPFTGTAVSPGAWRIRANYTNTFEQQGSPVSYLSEVFYLQGPKANCQGVGTSGSNGKGSNGVAGNFRMLEGFWMRVALVTFFFFSL